MNFIIVFWKTFAISY